MTSDQSKPPWMNIIWYISSSRLGKSDVEGFPTLGQPNEDIDKEIDALKESIDPYDKTALWDLAKRITNPYELISTFSNRLDLPRSTCCLRPLSRSFFKMIEILNHLNFFERQKYVKYKSLHICEGPGGFIEAFQHLAEDKKKIIQNSFAMTLKSTHTMIPGWKRATQFLQKHTNVVLLYGPNKTGDICEPENQQACYEAVGKSGAHLVTADGGFDFSEDFVNQEKNILKLLVNSAIILLECVAYEGDVVLKMFDCNFQTTRDLLRILSSCFHNWTLYKPVTSRPCNSEWYFIGRGAFRDRSVAIQHLKVIRDFIELNPTASIANLVAPNESNELFRTLQKTRSEKQKNSLKEVLEFCKDHETISYSALWEKQRQQTILWCNDHRMPSEYKLSSTK
jgi:23S rRNA U2552 (ribose-2'-O)-methylase RlmE/FtsJ